LKLSRFAVIIAANNEAEEDLMPRLLAIHVGLPADHGADSISEKPWRSGIFKTPVNEPVWLGTLNQAGDGQDDLENHGGPDRAALAYSAEHYPRWREALNRPDLAYGCFGENFTVSDLDEETVCIGDVYTIGAARVQVSQPRKPCWKLARRNGIKDLAARVDVAARGGWYLRVLVEGLVAPGDPVDLIERPYPALSVAHVYRLMHRRAEDPAAIAVLADLAALSPGWRANFARYAAEA
jgi:MOSC domain-containing protein YiiM